jgi:D-2-hydroxyacid dehydrogenase (NADP+)
MEIENILITGRLYKEIEELIPRNLSGKSFRFIAEENVTSSHFQWADVYVSFRPVKNFEFGKLKWVHSLGAGVDSFLFQREWKEDVLLTRTMCSFGQRISEYCLSYILKDLQLHRSFENGQREKSWNPIEPKLLTTQTVVVYGTGEIGQEIAKTLSFFGVKTIGVSLSGKEKPHFQQVVPLSSATDVLEHANWIISTLPLTEETNELFNGEFFSHLQNAGFINVGRGKTVDEAALLAALGYKNVRLAILDVFEEEPLPASSFLWEHPCITVTPHISAVTSPEEGIACFMETLERVEKGQTLINAVDVKKGY